MTARTVAPRPSLNPFPYAEWNASGGVALTRAQHTFGDAVTRNLTRRELEHLIRTLAPALCRLGLMDDFQAIGENSPWADGSPAADSGEGRGLSEATVESSVEYILTTLRKENAAVTIPVGRDAA